MPLSIGFVLAVQALAVSIRERGLDTLPLLTDVLSRCAVLPTKQKRVGHWMLRIETDQACK